MTTPEPSAVISAGDAREIAAAVLLDSYWHVLPVELALRGASVPDALGCAYFGFYGRADGSVYQFCERLTSPGITTAGTLMQAWAAGVRSARAFTAGRTAVDDSDRPDARTYRARCFAQACLDDQRLIAMSWTDYIRRYGLWPRARIAAAQADALSWQLQAAWLMATGAGPVLHCARIAHDRSLGRPARRRKPADPDWLAAELDAALSALWQAVRQADDGTGSAFWPPGIPSETRPCKEGVISTCQA